MKQKLLLAIGLVTSTLLSAQTPQQALEAWRTTDGTQNFFYRNVTKTDGSGNVYIAGATLASNGTTDILVTKKNSSGVTQWTQQYNGAANDHDFAAGLFIDASGNVYITGSATTNTMVMVPDMILIKYNSSGTQQWVATYSGIGYGSIGKTVTIDPAGDVFVVGATYNASLNTDMLVAKYNPSTGSQSWVTTYDHTSNLDDAAVDVGFFFSTAIVSGAVTQSPNNYSFSGLVLSRSTGSITVVNTSTAVSTSSIEVVSDFKTDATGNIYVAGTANVTGQGKDFFVIKMTNTLSIAWERTYNGADNLDDVAKSLQVDASGNVYATGYTTSSTQGKNWITRKYNSSGTLQWSQTINSSNSGDDEAFAMEMDNSSNLYITGYINGQTTKADYYTVKYDAGGNKIWDVQSDDYSLDDRATNIALDQNNNVVVSGTRETSPGQYDYLTMKYDQFDGKPPIDITSETPNVSYLYYENKGQILNEAGTAVLDEVSHIAMDVYPLMYFRQGSFSYKLFNLDTLSAIDDTIQRIDIIHKDGRDGVKSYSMDKAQGVLNIFDTELLSEVTDVQGFRRVFSPNVYPGIDAYYYSNTSGFKMYYYIHPGADPRNIRWLISGANSTTITGTNLEIQGINAKMVYDQPLFYQTNLAGTTTSTLAAGTWTNVSTNLYEFDLPSYNNSLPLIIQLDYGNVTHSNAALANLQHMTYYGGALDEMFKAMKTNPTNGRYVVTGITRSYDANRQFPTGAGVLTSPVPLTGTTNDYMTVVIFDSIGVRLCANIFGGGSNYNPMDLVYNNTTGAVTIVGNTLASSFPTTLAGNLTPGTYSSANGQGFAVQFEQQSPNSPSLNVVKWKTKLNGYVTGIGMKPTSKDIYITTATRNSSFTADLQSKANAYNNSTSYTNWHYQVSKFDAVGIRSWASYFPAFSNATSFILNTYNNYFNPNNGPAGDQNIKCKIDCDDYGFTIAGEVRDTGLVAFNKYGATGLDFTHNGNNDAFVTRFNSKDSIVFSQYVGGSSNDGFLDIKYSNPNEILLSGYSQSTQYQNLTYRSNSSQYIDTVMPTGATKMLITKIDSTGQKIWSTFYGVGSGSGQTCLGWSISNDGTGQAFLTGVTTTNEFRIAASNGAGIMNNTSQQNCTGCSVPGYADAFMLGITPYNTIAWNTYLGGKANECGLGVEYDSYKQRLLVTGYTNTEHQGSNILFPVTNHAPGNPNVWYKDALNASEGNVQLYSGSSDGYLGWFTVTNLVGIREYFKDNSANDIFNLYPNPSNSDTYIAFKNKIDGQVLIEIYNVAGQLVFSNVKNGIFDKAIITLPTASLANGMYIVNVKNENASCSKKLLISK